MPRPMPIAVAALILTTIFVLTSWNYRDHLDSITKYSKPKQHPALTNQFDLPENQNWTHVIWQTSKFPTETQSDTDHARSKTWAELNPFYRHEMMTHERLVGYTEDQFQYSHPELVQVYRETKDYMLRTDVARYLLLLKDGGVYNDLDVDCLQPIDSWIPEQFKDKAGIVMGIETDHQDKGDDWIWQVVVWTMLAKPNQPFIRFVLDKLIHDMRNVSAEEQAELSMDGVLQLTGPAATTADFLEYAALVTGTEVTYKNYSKITEPVMVGEIVLLPIWAFGASHQVLNSGFNPNDKDKVALVRHNFANSWKGDHKEGPPPTPPSS